MTTTRRNPGKARLASGSTILLLAAILLGSPVAQAQHDHHALHGPEPDPREGLSAGWTDAGEAAHGLELVASVPRPPGFYNPDDLGDMSVANSDLAFFGDYVVIGNFNGFNIYDVSDPSAPELKTSVVCPGGQGDVSVYDNLLFMSVEEARGRIDCSLGVSRMPADPERFRGVRVFDISDIDAPVQVAAVQTCRGSHTHTVVTAPEDPDNVYVYVSGSSYVRPAEELEGCSRLAPDEDPETALFRIEVIQVPLAAPEQARVVNMPRLFADQETGDIAGLWPGGDHGEGTQRTAVTNHCHDITVFPEIGLAAGACSGNGILLDIRDPVNPVRIHEVSDPNFAYWHSATFNNDGTKVIFTDEWGGGMAPRCRPSDPDEWGANAVFDIVDGRMHFAGYYKLPAVQTDTENCVAHNGSIIPVPGRDIKVQAWYQGGVSVFDFTDSQNPVEIAFFDRGPLSETQLHTGGFWSTYWYNGLVYGSEIARGLDVLRLTPTEHLSESEIAAAQLVRFDLLNVQEQPRYRWPAEPAVARAYIDQLERNNTLPATRLAELRQVLDGLEPTTERRDLAQSQQQLVALTAPLEAEARAAEETGRAVDARRLSDLAAVLSELAGAAR
jgi:hypothetical protein